VKMPKKVCQDCGEKLPASYPDSWVHLCDYCNKLTQEAGFEAMKLAHERHRIAMEG
jgi:hypothetical protein